MPKRRGDATCRIGASLNWCWPESEKRSRRRPAAAVPDGLLPFQSWCRDQPPLPRPGSVSPLFTMRMLESILKHCFPCFCLAPRYHKRQCFHFLFFVCAFFPFFSAFFNYLPTSVHLSEALVPHASHIPSGSVSSGGAIFFLFPPLSRKNTRLPTMIAPS